LRSLKQQRDSHQKPTNSLDHQLVVICRFLSGGDGILDEAEVRGNRKSTGTMTRPAETRRTLIGWVIRRASSYRVQGPLAWFFFPLNSTRDSFRLLSGMKSLSLSHSSERAAKSGGRSKRTLLYTVSN